MRGGGVDSSIQTILKTTLSTKLHRIQLSYCYHLIHHKTLHKESALPTSPPLPHPPVRPSPTHQLHSTPPHLLELSLTDPVPVEDDLGRLEACGLVELDQHLPHHTAQLNNDFLWEQRISLAVGLSSVLNACNTSHYFWTSTHPSPLPTSPPLPPPSPLSLTCRCCCTLTVALYRLGWASMEPTIWTHERQHVV